MQSMADRACATHPPPPPNGMDHGSDMDPIPPLLPSKMDQTPINLQKTAACRTAHTASSPNLIPRMVWIMDRTIC